MKSTYTTVVGNKTTYHYKYSDLKEFLKLGFKYGDVGMIVVCKDGGLFTYKGFGVIENPIRHIMTMSIMSHPLFDDPEPTEPSAPSKYSTKMMFLDMSK